jgi:hypothetical protein
LAKRNYELFLENLSFLSARAPNSSALIRLKKNYAIKNREERKKYQFKVVLSVSLSLALLALVSYSTRNSWNEWLTRPSADPLGEKTNSSTFGTAEFSAKEPPSSKRKANVDNAIASVGSVHFQIPSDAEVFWDYRKVDQNKLLTDQRVGYHTLIVNRPGQELVKSDIKINPNKTTEVNVK